MLKLPAHEHYKTEDGTTTVSIFQDDAQFWRFYLIPGFPTVRLDQNNNPVFMLIKYNLSDESREENPDLPRGGGYMVFDSELTVKAEHVKEIKKHLQQFVEKEWDRIKNDPNARVRSLTLQAAKNDQAPKIGGHWGQQGHEGTPRASALPLQIPTIAAAEATQGGTPPQVEIGEPLWKSGKVTMNAPSSAALVSGKIGERPASLLGNNVAAFSLDLTTDGATFMEKTLVGTDGRGATDLTPIQVVYELTMLAKLPPASMYIKVDMASVYHSLQELYHEHTNCTDDYFTSETMMSSAREAGLVTIKINPGGNPDPEMLKMLMQQATDQVQQILTDKLAKKERAPMKEWADADLNASSSEVYRLKQVSEIDMTTFETTMDIETTIEHKIAPQGTLQTFFHNRGDMTPFVRKVDLNDPFFKVLGLKARAFAKWAEDGVAFVELEVKYGKGNEIKTQSFTFTPQQNEPIEWSPSLIDGKREYEYRSRIGFVGREAGDWTKWEKNTARNLNVAVETPGKLDVEVSGVGLNYTDVLDAVLVHLRYEDTAHDVPMASQSILLTTERGSGKWTRQLFAPWEKPLEYRIEYLLKSGTTIEVPWKKTDGPTNNVLVKRPDVDVLDLTLIPSGNWADAIQAVLSLRYQDGTYNKDAQFNFKTADEFKKWAVLLQNPRKREFEYKILATFKNGDTQETTWLKRDGDQALPVTVIGPPRLITKVSGAVLDYASTPLAKVDLEYKDPQGSSDVESFSLQAASDVKTWSIPIREGGPKGYRYKITYFPKDGNPIERQWEATDAELIVVPRYSIPKVGAEFSPVMQKFDVTPAVEVNLAYDNPQSNMHERMTLIFQSKDKQSWFLPVPDSAPRKYDMTITWFYNDGSHKNSTPVTLDKPAVVLPPPPPPAAQRPEA